MIARVCVGAAIGGIAALLAGCVSPAAREPLADASRSARVLQLWRADLDSLAMATARLDSAAVAMRVPSDTTAVREAFRQARRQFKRVEVALEYYAPTTTRAINGPPVAEVEETEGPEVVLPPSGFQVIEALLYGSEPFAVRDTLRREIGVLREHITRAQTMFRAQQTTDAHVWDAARLELSRVLTLGLAGFDAAASGDALAEMQAALDGIARTLARYATHDSTWGALIEGLRNATLAVTRREPDGSFNSLAFLAGHGVPLGRTLVKARDALAIGTPAERRAFRMTAASVFEPDAIDPDGFAPLGLDRAAPTRIALGRALFADGRLSATGQRSCASCHVPSRAFTDGQVRASSLTGTRLTRNTPTVLNSGLQLGQFADLRTTYLEDQVTEVVQNPAEMHGSLERAARVLAADARIRALFVAAFPTPSHPDSVVTPLRIRYAVGAYIRSLSRLDAPVDRAMRGDTLALTADARAGFNLFVGKARCASCHFLPLTNGTVPPMYQRSELEVLGVPVRDVAHGARIDADPGRYAISRSSPHQHAFRTPTLRNVALTAPYMHNGAFTTLASVIVFYNRGGGAGIGIALPNQTLAPEALHLTAGEQRQLVRFLEALTDTTGLR